MKEKFWYCPFCERKKNKSSAVGPSFFLSPQNVQFEAFLTGHRKIKGALQFVSCLLCYKMLHQIVCLKNSQIRVSSGRFFYKHGMIMNQFKVRLSKKSISSSDGESVFNSVENQGTEDAQNTMVQYVKI